MNPMAYGRPEPVAERVARLLAPNPSAFTFTGTLTYLVGTESLVVIDPGPDLPDHVDSMMAALAGREVAAIMCTHTHRDHSPASRPLAKLTGAPIIGCAPLALDDQGPRLDTSFDPDYRPDRILADGETFGWDGLELRAVATPGHTSNHLCFAIERDGILFSGDHVMGWSTTIVSPPDGDMADYMASLDMLLRRGDRIYFPAHGPAITRPAERLEELVIHRRARERQIVDVLAGGGMAIGEMVPTIYQDVDPGLYPAAARSVLAHLIDLESRGMVTREGETWAIARSSSP